MQKLPAAIIIAIMLASSAFCQVDTLMLVEVNSFEVSGEITQIYTESIRDNYKEIFICTDNHIYVYDSQTNELIWSRGELINPQDLLFEDINNDGFKDLAFRDSLNIFLYDVINSDLIWTSPVLDSTYKCYTVGDRNDDNAKDIIIINQIPTSNESDYDTVRTNIFDGPQFQNIDSFDFLIPCYYFSDSHPEISVHHTETPNKVIIAHLICNNEVVPYIIIFTNYIHDVGGHPAITEYTMNGDIRLANCNTLSIALLEDTGRNMYINTNYIDDSTTMLNIASSYSAHFEFGNRKIYKNIITCDSFNQQYFWRQDYESEPHHNYNGYIVDDIINNNSTLELCFAYLDTLYLYNMNDSERIWHYSYALGLIEVKSLINCSILPICNNILCKIEDEDFIFIIHNAEDGRIIANIQSDVDISQVTNLNNDNNDELLSIDGSTLNIYNLEYYVSIDNPTAVPRSTFLKANYPNPFNSSTIIEYALNRDEQITLEIYDLLGRHVETLVDDYQTAGLHQAVWNAENVSSGVYFYNLKAGDFVKAKKMLMLK